MGVDMHSCPPPWLEKVKVLPYSLPTVGPGADPIVQAVSPQITVSHPPDGRLPLLFAWLHLCKNAKV